MDSIFTELAIILALACAYGLLTLKLRLPLVVAYLLAGVTLSFFNSANASVLAELPEIGIALVLFLVGMELNLGEIRSLGKPIVFATLIQIALSSVVGYWIASHFGFTGIEGILVGFALAFSSTVVIIKTLLEKRDLASLYGKLSVGILLVEDLVAILLMTTVTTGLFDTGFAMSDALPLALFLAKALGLVALAFLASRFVMDRVFDICARSTELLFLAAITWCFVFTSLAVISGFSVVIGAFIAGIGLATSPYEIEIQGKVKPLRDFFVALFFVYVGSQVDVGYIIDAWPVTLAFAAIALFIKPVVYLTGLSFFGFRKHTLFQTGLNMTQVSEFSLIILLLGVEYGVVSPAALSVVAGASVISIMVSSIMIANSDRLYRIARPFVAFLQRERTTDIPASDGGAALIDHVVIIGADRVGHAVVEHLKSRNIPLLVLDYNPEIIKGLRAEGIRAIYGDLSDPDIIEHLELEKAKLVISTASGLIDNETLLEAVKRKGAAAQIVVRATEPEHEAIYKEMGADYVILPERVSGDYLVWKLKNEWPNVTFGQPPVLRI